MKVPSEPLNFLLKWPKVIYSTPESPVLTCFKMGDFCFVKNSLVNIVRGICFTNVGLNCDSLNARIGFRGRIRKEVPLKIGVVTGVLSCLPDGCI